MFPPSPTPRRDSRRIATQIIRSELAPARSLNGNANPYVAFAHKLMDFNSRMPFVSFEESYEHFKKTGALDEPNNSNFSLQNFIQ